MINLNTVERVFAHTILYKGVHYPITDVEIAQCIDYDDTVKLVYIDGTSWVYPKEIIMQNLNG